MLAHEKERDLSRKNARSVGLTKEKNRGTMMYAKCFKRLIDALLSLTALLILSPVLLILTVVGAIVMKGNPFFTQRRPGKNEKIFKLIKFRTMTNAKDKDGNLLPDEQRLVKYGKILRSTSLDELPELLNILKGDMALVGPRPLLPEYLPYYTSQERHRHDVRPGLTGLAQISGRNFVCWDDRLALDVQYVNHITMLTDLSILFKTVLQLFNRKAVAVDTRKVEPNFAKERQEKNENQTRGVL